MSNVVFSAIAVAILATGCSSKIDCSTVNTVMDDTDIARQCYEKEYAACQSNPSCAAADKAIELANEAAKMAEEAAQGPEYYD